MMVWKRIVFSTMEILVSMLVGWGCILGVLFLGEVLGMLSCGELWVCHREFWWQNLTFGNSGWGTVCCGGPWNLSGVSQSGEKANASLKGSWGHCTHLNWPHCTVNLTWISAREIKGIASRSLPSYLCLSLLVEWFRFASAEISGMKCNFLPEPHWLRPWSSWTMTCMSRLGDTYCVDGLRHCVLQRGIFLLFADNIGFYG